MAKKNQKHTPRLHKHEEDSLHLSEFSQGKPFELSFNVLENKAREQAPKKESLFSRLFSREKAGAEQTSEQSLITEETTSFTPAKSASFLDADSHAEIARRQKHRKFARTVSICVVILISLGLLGAGGYYLWQQHEERLSNVELIQRAAEHIEKSDETLVQIDAFFQESFNDNTLARIEELKAMLPSTRSELQEAKDYAQRADAGLQGNNDDKTAAENTLKTIASRETMLSVAEKRLTEDANAYQSVLDMHNAWTKIEEANSLIAQAAVVVSQTSVETTNQSTEYLNSARAALEEAQGLINQVETRYPSADISLEKSYIEERLVAVNEALASNEAILIQDKKTAESHNEAYNQSDARAAELATSLPDDFAQPIFDAYRASSESLSEEYESIRADVARSDSFLRDYLA